MHGFEGQLVSDREARLFAFAEHSPARGLPPAPIKSLADALSYVIDGYATSGLNVEVNASRTTTLAGLPAMKFLGVAQVPAKSPVQIEEILALRELSTGWTVLYQMGLRAPKRRFDSDAAALRSLLV